MANHPSAAKRARQCEKRTLRNRLVMGTLRTSLKRARTALESGDTGQAGPLVKEASRLAAKAASKGSLHRNKASRLQSRLQLALKKLGAAPADAQASS